MVLKTITYADTIQNARFVQTRHAVEQNAMGTVELRLMHCRLLCDDTRAIVRKRRHKLTKLQIQATKNNTSSRLSPGRHKYEEKFNV